MRQKSNSPLYNTRRARSMTQAQLAGLVEVSKQTIAKAERGILHLTPDLQLRIATVLGATRHELFPEEQRVAS